MLLVQAIKFWLDSKITMPLAYAQNELPNALQKKYPCADLTNYEGLFLKTGFVVTIVYCIIVFSLTFYETKFVLPPNTTPIDEIDIIEMPVTYVEQKEIPPVIKPEMKTPEVNIVLVDKDVEATKDDKLIKEEVDDKTTVENNTRFVVPIEEEEKDEIMPFVLVQDKPEFPGGEAVLQQYLSKCEYSRFCKENEIEGTVTVGFTIDKKGAVTNVKILRSPDKCLNTAALNHVKNMPAWTPGKQRGKPVSVTYAVPLKFRLL